MARDYSKQPTGSKEPCEFCGDPQHYGLCAEMADAQGRATSALQPVVNPRVRN